MNTTLFQFFASGPRPRVFVCSRVPRWDRVRLGFLGASFLFCVLTPLLWYQGPLWPDYMVVGLFWGGLVWWMTCFGWMLWWSGLIRVYPDSIVVGAWPTSHSFPRDTIASVERWRAPLLGGATEVTHTRGQTAGLGYARNHTLDRFRHYVTCEDNAVVIRWTGNIPLVVTPNDPDRFMDAVRPAGATQPS